MPLSRLLRLSLLQVSVGMSLVLLVGTLNRVMIVELGIAASLVAGMIALPVLFAPFRALIGHRSDTHVSVLGWKRVPFIYRGTMVQFGGLAIMPFALLVLSGGGNAGAYPAWIGQAAAALAFLLVGAGIHTTQTVGLALATDQTPQELHPKVVGLMFVMLLVGSILSALIFGYLLEEFSPGRLIQVIQGSAVVTIVLNAIALWKQEGLKRLTKSELETPQPTFSQSWRMCMQGEGAVRRLIVVGLGTMAFGMQDVLLEPYGGEILGLTVAGTTKLTAALGGGCLFGLGVASYVLSRGSDAFAMAGLGGLLGIIGFSGVILAAPMASSALFTLGVLVIGLGGGIFSHGTLTATMQHAPREQTGLALGAWGAVQATAAGIGMAAGGMVHDISVLTLSKDSFGAARGYTLVYALEIVLLLITLALMARCWSGAVRSEGMQSAGLGT